MKRKTSTFLMSLLMTLVVATTFGQNDENVVLIRDVNIFDGVNEKLLEGYDVLVVNNLIKKIDRNIQSADSYEKDGIIYKNTLK